MRGFTAALTVSIVVPISTLSAQQQPPIEPGARVRVTHQCESRLLPVTGEMRTRCREDQGTLAALTTDVLVLVVDRQDSELSISLDSVTEVAVSSGKRSHILAGAGGGALLGTAVGAVASSAKSCTDEWGSLCTAGGAAQGAIIGLVTGLFIGAAIKTDRWEEVPLDRLRVSFAPRRDGLAIGMRFAF